MEIREEIFGYLRLMLGRHIRTNDKPHEHRKRQKNYVRYHEHIPGGLWSDKAPRDPQGFPTHPSWTFSDQDPNVFADEGPSYPDWKQMCELYRVCRSFYAHFSMMYWTHNVFSFDSVWVTRKWLESVKPCQLRAIRRIVPPSDRDLPKTTIKKLPSLKAVYETGFYLMTPQTQGMRDELREFWRGRGVEAVLWHPLKEDGESRSPPR